MWLFQHINPVKLTGAGETSGHLTTSLQIPSFHIVVFNREDPINSGSTEPDADSCLSGCSHTEAPQWLKERPTDISSVDRTLRTRTNSHVIEYILFRRNSPFIDLALAQFGRSKTVLQRIYATYPGELNLVAHPSPSLFLGHRIRTPEFDEGNNLNAWGIIHTGDIGEVQVIHKNTGLPSGFYSAQISSWEELIAQKIIPPSPFPFP